MSPLDGGSADGRVGIGERESLLSPCLPRADSRHDQPVSRHDTLQFIAVHQFGVADGEFDAVVAHAGDLGDVGFEIALEGHRFELGGLSGKNNAEFHWHSVV